MTPIWKPLTFEVACVRSGPMTRKLPSQYDEYAKSDDSITVVVTTFLDCPICNERRTYVNDLPIYADADSLRSSIKQNIQKYLPERVIGDKWHPKYHSCSHCGMVFVIPDERAESYRQSIIDYITMDFLMSQVVALGIQLGKVEFS